MRQAGERLESYNFQQKLSFKLSLSPTLSISVAAIGIEPLGLNGDGSIIRCVQLQSYATEAFLE